MRDILIFSIFIAVLVLVFKRSYIGALLWAWISIMNPHRYSYGFVFSMPLAMITAVVTLFSMLTNRSQVRGIPSLSVVWIWGGFCLWMMITTVGAFYVPESLDSLNKVGKIMFMLFLTMMLVFEKQQILTLVWVYAMSIGLLGLKSGVFTLLGGGGDRVWGPPGSFIEGNNEIGLAFVVVIPILYYLTFQTGNKWIKLFTFACAAASAIATFGTQSRGAFLAIAAMAGFLWIKSDRKLLLGLALIVGGAAILAFMPESWHSRMDTISNYQEDGSAMGRINAWAMAYNLANDNFLGGGFDIYNGIMFARYAPVPDDIHAAHSIYFQVLGEHGYIGLLLYLLFGVYSWRLAGQLQKRTIKNPSLDWISRFAAMAKVSIAGFAVGGAFLSLAYFDLPYYITVTLIVMYRWLDSQEEAKIRLVGPPSRARRNNVFEQEVLSDGGVKGVR